MGAHTAATTSRAVGLRIVAIELCSLTSTPSPSHWPPFPIIIHHQGGPHMVCIVIQMIPPRSMQSFSKVEGRMRSKVEGRLRPKGLTWWYNVSLSVQIQMIRIRLALLKDHTILSYSLAQQLLVELNSKLLSIAIKRPGAENKHSCERHVSLYSSWFSFPHQFGFLFQTNQSKKF